MKTEPQVTPEQYFELQEALSGMLFIQNMNEFIQRVTTAFRVHAAIENYVELDYGPNDFIIDAHDERMLSDLLRVIHDIRVANNDKIHLPDYPKDKKHES